MRFRRGKIFIALLASTLGAEIVQAQTSEQPGADQVAEVAAIEALIDSSGTPESALVAAQTQVAEGDVSGAATTLERALIADPDSVKTRAYYLALMCLLDDRMAADVELDKLAGAAIDDADWTNVERACGPLARPIAAQ